MKIVRESLSFERGKDPKKAMGVGLTAQIENWFRDNYEREPNEDLVHLIMNDDELDRDTKEEWVKHLVSSGYPFDEQAIEDSFSYNIDLVEYIPDGWKNSFHSLEIYKNSGNFFVAFDGWEDWADFVQPDNDRVEDYVSSVLSGDSYQYFEQYEYDYIDSDSINYFIEGKEDKINSLAYLRDLYEYKAKEEDREILEESEDMIEDIFENYDELASALQRALLSAMESANESAAYNKMKKEIEDHYELRDVKWDDNKKQWIAQIPVDGLERIMDSYWWGERRWEHKEPYNGYMADPNVETFDVELDNQLSNVS